jgi:hypothetical protein
MLQEPAQATKLAASDSSTDGLPKEGSNGLPGPGREPEMGQEPAGPDQALPVPSEPTGGQQPPIPRERTATSYINVSHVVPKYTLLMAVASKVSVNDVSCWCRCASHACVVLEVGGGGGAVILKKGLNRHYISSQANENVNYFSFTFTRGEPKITGIYFYYFLFCIFIELCISPLQSIVHVHCACAFSLIAKGLKQERTQQSTTDKPLTQD